MFTIERRNNDGTVKVVARFETKAERDAAWLENVIGRSDSYMFQIRDNVN